MVASIFGLIGLAAVAITGHWVLSLSVGELLISVLAANTAAFISMLLTIWFERVPWIRQHILNRSMKVWINLAILYTLVLLALSPALREPSRFLILFLPLILASSFSFLVYGPVQDKLVALQARVRRHQRHQLDGGR